MEETPFLSSFDIRSSFFTWSRNFGIFPFKLIYEIKSSSTGNCKGKILGIGQENKGPIFILSNVILFIWALSSGLIFSKLVQFILYHEDLSSRLVLGQLILSLCAVGTLGIAIKYYKDGYKICELYTSLILLEREIFGIIIN